jgi:hypothetical protein
MAKPPGRVREVLKVDRKTFFNPSGWFDYSTIAAINVLIIDVIRSAFFLPKSDIKVEPETFEQSVKRQNLSEKALKEAHQSYKNFAYAFCAIGIADFIYTLYLLFFHFSILGFMLGVSTSLLFFGQAFRFDFWAFQIHKRKLGLTIADWKKNLLGK